MKSAPRIVGVVQARMNSTRFPGKVLAPLAGAPMLQRLLERARGASSLDALVVATSDRAIDDAIEALCVRLATRCYRGSESDVLGRILMAAGAERADAVVRLTGDNPFLDGALIDLVVADFLAAVPPADYAHNVDDCGFPFGLFVEVCRIAALQAAARSANPADREHVTWYVRQRPGEFRHVAVRTSAEFCEQALSIDTAEDYQRLKPLFEALFAADPAFDHRALMARAHATR